MSIGLEMSKMFYTELGKPMIDMDFSLYKKSMAFGLVGQGSECLSYDDMISRDHDYAPGFCIWIPQSLKDEIGNNLQKAYDLLSMNDFLIKHKDKFNLYLRDVFMTGARANRIGVHSIEEFFFEHTGITHAPETFEDWTKTHPMFISEVVNGEVFDDYLGEFSKIRNKWLSYYPEDILKKKVAANCAMAAKTGQFNYKRSLDRDDLYSAYNCSVEFIKKISAVLYLLNKKYMPYYKWVFRGMDEFSICTDAVPLLKNLTQLTEKDSDKKIALIEQISSIVIKELKNRDWSNGDTDYLLDHAKIIMKTIKDNNIASMNIFVGED